MHPPPVPPRENRAPLSKGSPFARRKTLGDCLAHAASHSIPPTPPPRRRRKTVSSGINELAIQNITKNEDISAIIDSWLPPDQHSQNELTTHSYGETSKRRQLLHKLKRPKIAVFETPLSEYDEEGYNIPILVFQCVEFLSSDNRLATEGIFRIPGNRSSVEKFCEEYKHIGDSVNFKELSPNVHTVAGVLQSFFQRLPEGLIPPKYSECMIKVCDDDRDDDDKIHMVSEILRRLPKVNLDTLRFLLSFLYNVSQHSQANQMTITNLAILWGPTLMRQESQDSFLLLSESEKVTRVLEFMLTNWHLILVDPRHTK